MAHRIESEKINLEGSERIEITTRQLMKDGSVKVETIECDSYIIFLEKTRMINDGQIHVSSGCAGPSQSLLNIVDGLPQMIKVMASVISNLADKAINKATEKVAELPRSPFVLPKHEPVKVNLCPCGCGQERTH